MKLNSKLYVNLSCAMSVNMRYSMFREFYFVPNCLSKEGRKKSDNCNLRFSGKCVSVSFQSHSCSLKQGKKTSLEVKIAVDTMSNTTFLDFPLN